MFFEKHKRVFQICFLILIPLLLICSVTINIDKSVTIVRDLSPFNIASCYNSGYRMEAPNENFGNWKYTSENYDPNIYFFLESEHFNKVSIKFSEGNNEEDIDYVQLYYTHEKEPNINEKNSLMGSFQNDGRTVEFYLPAENYEIIRLDVGGTFALDGIQFIKYERVNQINTVPFIIFILMLALSLALEIKVGLYRAIYVKIKNEILKYKDAKNVRGIISLSVRWLAIIITSAFVITLYVFLVRITYNYASILAIFWLGAIAAFLDIVYVIFFSEKKNAAVLFLILSLIFGAVLSYTLPISTFNSWDEDVHYQNSVSLKSMLFINRHSNADTKQGYRLYAKHDEYIKDIDSKISEMLYDNSTNDWRERDFINPYSNMTYLPNAVVMTVADILSMNYFTEIVLLKLVNMTLYALIIYLGIKRIKSGKMLASAIALIPTSVFMATSFSYDHWVMAFTIYGICYFISEMQTPDKLFTRKDGVKMFGSMLIGCSIKAIYFVLMLPMFFMKDYKFENVKQKKLYRIVCLLVMIFILISFMLPFVVDMDSRTDNRGGEDVDAMAQVKFILSNPFKYAAILFDYMIEYLSPSNIIKDMASYCLIGNSHISSQIITLVFIVVIALLDRGADKYDNSRKIKLMSIVGVFASLVLIITALYVSYTPHMANYVKGVQPRYIFPLLFPLFMTIGLPLKRNVLDNNTGKSVVYGMLWLNLFGTFFSVYITQILALM